MYRNKVEVSDAIKKEAITLLSEKYKDNIDLDTMQFFETNEEEETYLVKFSSSENENCHFETIKLPNTTYNKESKAMSTVREKEIKKNAINAITNILTNPPQGSKREPIAREDINNMIVHIYTKEDGKPWYFKGRFLDKEGNKDIRPFNYHSDKWNLGESYYVNGIKKSIFGEGKKPLYRLHLLNTRLDEPLYICEGENCVDALEKLGLLATTSGAITSVDRTDWSVLKHRNKVIIWPDNDEKGLQCGNTIAHNAKSIIPNCEIEFTDISKLSLPEKGDVVDWIKHHKEPSKITKEDIQKLATIEYVEPVASQGTTDKPVSSSTRTWLESFKYSGEDLRKTDKYLNSEELERLKDNNASRKEVLKLAIKNSNVEAKKKEEEKEKKKPIHQLLDIIIDNFHLFKNIKHKYYAREKKTGLVYDINSPLFINIMINIFGNNFLYFSFPTEKQFEDIIKRLEYFASKNENNENAFLRYGYKANGNHTDYFLDLGNVKNSHCIKINKDDWEVLDESLINFYRTPLSHEIPLPNKDAKIEDFDHFFDTVNFPKEKKLLLLPWLINTMMPNVAQSILYITGEEGSAKTSFQRYTASLIDSEGCHENSARKEKDLITILSNCAIGGFGNVNHISDEFSDVLCQATTEFSTIQRLLYTNSGVYHDTIRRSFIINGVSDCVKLSELRSRVVMITLPRIIYHRSEKIIKEKFNEKRPLITGALLTIFQKTIKHLEEIIYTQLAKNESNYDELISTYVNDDRLRDFILIGMACAKAIGLDYKDFLNIYGQNRKEGMHSVYEGSLSMIYFIEFIDEELIRQGVNRFEDQTTLLMNKFKKFISKNDYDTKYIISSPKKLGELIEKNYKIIKEKGFLSAKNTNKKGSFWSFEINNLKQTNSEI